MVQYGHDMKVPMKDSATPPSVAPSTMLVSNNRAQVFAIKNATDIVGQLSEPSALARLKRGQRLNVPIRHYKHAARKNLTNSGQRNEFVGLDNHSIAWLTAIDRMELRCV